MYQLAARMGTQATGIFSNTLINVSSFPFVMYLKNNYFHIKITVKERKK